MYMNVYFFIRNRDDRLDRSSREGVEKKSRYSYILDLPLIMPIDRRLLGRKGILHRRDIFVTRDNYIKYGLKLTDQRELPLSFDDIFRGKNMTRCALVGNSGNVLEISRGDEIDQHSLITRLNQAPTKGYTKYVGKKVSYRLFNALWTKSYTHSHMRDDGSLDNRKGIKIGSVTHLPLETNATIIVSRTSWENFASLYAAVKKDRPDVKVLLLAPRIVTSVKWILKEYRLLLSKSSKNGEVDGGGQTPSSGLIAVFLLLQMCDKLDLYGFGRMKSTKAKYHYYNGVGHRTIGSNVHNWNVENFLLKSLHDGGLLRLF